VLWFTSEKSSTRGFRRVLGLFSAFSLGLGSMIGSGIYISPGEAAVAGPFSLVAWTAVGFLIMPIALSFARFGRKLTRTGGAYEYVKSSLGDFWGIITGIGFWLAYVVVIATLGRALSRYASFIIPIASETQWSIIIALSAIWTITIINLIGVRMGGLTNNALTLIKLFPLVAFVALLTPHISLNNLSVKGYVELDAISVAMSAALWAYLGFEAVNPPSEEMINPENNIPKGIVYSLLAVMALYVLVTTAALGSTPAEELASSPAPLAYVMSKTYGRAVGNLMFLAATISILGCLAATILPNARVAYALARDGYLPRSLAKLNRFDVPSASLVLQAVLASVLAILYGFVKLYLISDLTSLVPYLTVSLSLVVRDKSTLWRGVGALGVLASAYLVYSVLTVEFETLLGVLVIVILSAIAYAVARARR